jgi:DNA ligase-1
VDRSPSITPLARLADLAQKLGRTTKRLELTGLVADCLWGLDPEEVPAAVRLILGQVFPEWDGRTLNLSWKAATIVVEELTAATPAQREAIFADAVDGGEAVATLFARHLRQQPQPPPLTILDVYHTFEQVAAASGRGSRARKAALLRGLLARATPAEASLIVKNLFGEMRHGVGEGVMLAAIAQAADVKLALVRRANMLWGDLGEVASVALVQGGPALAQASVRVFRPLKAMLAQTADDMAEVLERHQGRTALEYKLDGARVQIHKQGAEVRIFSRQLADVTASLPDVAAAVRAGLRAREAVVEGEVVAEDRAGRPLRPLPFQQLMRRFRRKHDVETVARQVPVQLYPFDLLYRDGVSLIDRRNVERWQALAEIAGEIETVRRLVTGDPTEGEAFLRAAYEAGHEGLVAKSLDSTYQPGVRGRGWLKLKHVETLDLVIVAADWGYGRRKGWLSNYHLAVGDDGGFSVVGKTFKGPTDAEFGALTERLLGLERARRGSTVFVKPQVVVEVAFNEVQQSPRYESGFALRFARIVRVREDKGPAQADTLVRVRTVYEQQFIYKGRIEE